MVVKFILVAHLARLFLLKFLIFTLIVIVVLHQVVLVLPFLLLFFVKRLDGRWVSHIFLHLVHFPSQSTCCPRILAELLLLDKFGPADIKLRHPLKIKYNFVSSLDTAIAVPEGPNAHRNLKVFQLVRLHFFLYCKRVLSLLPNCFFEIYLQVPHTNRNLIGYKAVSQDL